MTEPQNPSLWPTLGLVLVIAFGGAAALSAIIGDPGTALASAAVSALLLLRCGASLAGGPGTITAVFLFFHFLYGVSGPATAIYGEPLADIFSRPYATAPFLAAFGLASLGLAVGFALGWRRSAGEAPRLQVVATPNEIAQLAFWIAVAASGMEFVNMFRAGGIGLVALGKAAYQSATEDLTLTLPSTQMATLAVALAGLAASSARAVGDRIAKRHLAFFIMALLPIVTVTLVLGRRGPLLAWMFAGLLAAQYYTPVRRLRARVVMTLLGAYVFMGFLFANRFAIGVATFSGNWSFVVAQAMEHEQVVAALNPGNNEFGAPFGNFSEYYNQGGGPWRLGSTYAVAVTLPIPRFVYPGTKPTQIPYEFRDRYFPALGVDGSIAGSGFSSVLEAYMNMGYVGVVIAYAFFGLALMLAERGRARAHLLLYDLVYLTSAPLMIEFHRSSIAEAFAGVLFNIMLAVVAVMGLQALQVIRRGTQSALSRVSVYG